MPTAAELVFEALVNDILAGTLRPRDPVSERDLVARFGVSRTPIREALQRLSEKGFFETGPKGVAVVADVSFEDLEALYELRIHVEEFAAGLVTRNITQQEIRELRKVNRRFRAALDERDLTKLLEIRAEFHMLLEGYTEPLDPRGADHAARPGIRGPPHALARRFFADQGSRNA